MSTIVVFDIETTGFHADQANLLVAAVYEPKTRKLRDYRAWGLSGATEPEFERAALTGLLTDLANAGVIVSYYGKRFDIPFIKARCAALGVRMPALPPHIDVYFVVRHNLAVSRRSLESITRLLRLRAHKSHFPPSVLHTRYPRLTPRERRMLRRRCGGDVRLTWQVAERLARLLTAGPGTQLGRLRSILCPRSDRSTRRPRLRRATARRTGR